MKKSRIFMAGGTLILAISAIFATKANKKFTASFSTAQGKVGVSNYIIKAPSGNIFTCSAAAHYFAVDAKLVTSLGSVLIDLGTLKTAVTPSGAATAFTYYGL